MIKNKLYKYGDQNGKVPAHLHFGKDMYHNMLKNRNINALINASTDERMTYGQMAHMTASVSLSLTRIGVGKGDVVCICSEKKFEVLPTIVGIICAGAAFSPMDLTYGTQPLLHRLKIARPKVMICSQAAFASHKATFDSVGTIQHYIMYGDTKEDGCQLFQEFVTKDFDFEAFEPIPVDGTEDPTFIIYSSGTTGLPKGVPLTHLSVLLNTQTTVLDSYVGVPILNSREWYYTYGLMCTVALLRVGASIVFYTSYQMKDMLEAVQKYQTIGMQLAPTSIMELIKSVEVDRYDVSSVKWIMSCSTPISLEAVDAVKNRLRNLQEVYQLYGMTEVGCMTSELRAPLGPKSGSSGVACLGITIKVVDLNTREPVGAYQRGEICISGPSVMKGYVNNEVPDCKDAEGFFLTGDVGYYDNDGYFFIIDRIKELIKFDDISIAPAEFEALLLQHPVVREAGVVGQPDALHGEVPVAFVVLQPGCTATEQELVEHVNSRVTYRMSLAGGVRFVACLPLGAGAKLDRKQLRSMLDDYNKLS